LNKASLNWNKKHLKCEKKKTRNNIVESSPNEVGLLQDSHKKHIKLGY